MSVAYICDAVRTPIGRFGGALSGIRSDDLAAIPLIALKKRNKDIDWDAVDDVILGCANQAGEDNRNIARMAVLLANYGTVVPGTTVNRLCASGMDSIIMAARSIISKDAHMIIAGGVESMTRAPFVLPKSEYAFSRKTEIYDTSMGWRFVNPKLEAAHGAEAMPQTAENVAEQFNINREDQDLFAKNSQDRAEIAIKSGRFVKEIVPVSIPRRKQVDFVFDTDEHPRNSSFEVLQTLKPIVKQGGTVTAGNSSGINDGAAALIIASEAAVKRHHLTPRARFVASAVVGVPPRIMGIGPGPATQKVLAKMRYNIGDMDVIEINEAFASQSLATLRMLGLRDNTPHVNPNGGAIALGHPLGMSGTRIVMTAIEELHETGGHKALATMCIGVGQGIASIFERV
ncbi:MAG: 3-oxoadipyl-CoA thiolase [Alphaproteobacteria bacterium]|nr:MAG: 3-oxoadipyl-CoA thiolase [Alphaproteobacteria bacterium]